MPQDPYADALNTALNAAPDLVYSPSLAMAAASDPQPDLAAQAVAFAQQQQALQTAASNQLTAQQQAAGQIAAPKGGGPFGDFMHVLGGPAREVSHLYRYAREAFHTHGLWGGLAVLLPTAVGGVLGTALLPGMGTVLGAELGAEGSRLLGGDNEQAYNASSNGATFTINGKAVSPGRDLAHVFGFKNTDAGMGRIVSGFGDASFDVATDPTNIVGKVSSVRRSLDGFSSVQVFGKRIEVKNAFLNNIAPGVKIATPERLDQAVAAYGGVRRAFNRIAELDSGGIIHEFPELAPIAKDLGQAKTFDQVHQWFRGATIDENLQGRVLGTALPSLALFRPVTNKIRDAIQVEDINKGNIVARQSAKVWKTITGQQPFNVDSLGNISGSFKPDDVGALKGVYDTMRFGMGVKAAQRWTTVFANADSLAEKKAIWANAMDEMLKAAGFPSGVDEFQKVTGRARGFATGDGLERFGAGHDRGDLINEVLDDQGNLKGRFALYQHQNGELAFPNFSQVKTALRSLSLWKKALGGVDDFVAAAYTDKIFKPLAVMSLGFGVRDALSETLPGMFQHGTFNMLRGMVNGQAAKLGYKLDNAVDESHHVVGVMSKLAGGAAKLLGKSQDWQEDAAWLAMHNGGHIVTGAAAAGHQVAAFGTQNPLSQMEDILQEAGRRNVGRLGKEAGHPAYHGTGQYKLFSPTDNVFPDYWVSGLQKRALEPSVQAIARDLAAMRSGVDDTGETLYHGTPHQFDTFSEDAAQARGAHSAPRPDGKRNLYFSDNPEVAKRFAWQTAGVGYVSGDIPSEEGWKLLRQEAAKNDGSRFAYPDDAGKMVYAKTLDDIPSGYDASEIAVVQKGFNPRVIKTTVHGKTLDLRPPKGADKLDHEQWVKTLPPDLIEGLKKEGRFRPDDYFRGTVNFTHEQSAFLTKWAREHGYGKIRVPDTYESGFHSVIALPEYIGKHPVADLTNEHVTAKLINNERQRIEAGQYKVNRSASSLKGESEGTLLSRYGMEDPAAFAAARVDDVKNYVLGRDGAVHDNLIEKLARGEKPTHEDIADVSVDSMPDRLVGEDLHPIMPKNMYDRLLQVGFKKLVEPFSSFFSRQPIYLNQFREEKAALQEFVDKGIFTADQARELAVQRAAKNIIPQVQIPEIRSQLSILARNIMPFYYAQEQAVRRAATLIKSHPEAVAKYAWVNYFMTNPAWMQTDDAGNRFVSVPGSGMFGHLLQGALSPVVGMPIVQGLPLSYNGTVESFKNAMPYSPLANQGSGFGLSPIVSLGFNWFANRDPSFAPIAKDALGNISYQQNWYNTFIPSTPLRAIVTAMTAPDRDRAFANAQLSALQAAYYHDKFPKVHADGTPPSPAELQKFQDEIKNNARTAFLAKAVVDFVSPIGGSPVLQDIGPDGKTFSQEFYALLKQKGNIADATLEFMKEHGDKSISYTVSHSTKDMGVSVPETSKAALNFIDGHRDLIEKYGAAAAYLIPQNEDGNGDLNLIHNELLQLKVQHTDTPDEFKDAIYTTVGNSQYFAKRDERDALLAQYKGNKVATAAINSNWSDWTAQFNVQNPIWADAFYTQKRTNNAKTALQGLQTMAQNNELPAGPQTNLVMQMVNNYYNQKAALAQLGGSTMFDRQRKQIKDNWSAYLDQVKKSQPLLSDVLYSVFVPLESLA